MQAPDPQYLSQPIYLDAHATTPCEGRVVEAMLPFFASEFGNPSNTANAYGRRAADAVELARTRVAQLVNASPAEILFTSSATEACNLVIKSVVARRVITVATAHKAVLSPCARVAMRGAESVVLPVRPDGLLDLHRLEVALGQGADLVAVLAANNETGVVEPLEDIAELCARTGTPLLVDATQLVPWAQLDLACLPADFVAFSAHKMYGPKGAGALYVRRGAGRALQPLIEGGGQERKLRAGTVNVPAVVGFGVAAAITMHEAPDCAARVRLLRDRLLHRLTTELTGAHVNGSLASRLPNNLNLAFEGVEADALLTALPDLALSTGSACNQGALEPSHVLRAMGLDDDLAWSSVRFGLGRLTTAVEVDYSATRIVAAVREIRDLTDWEPRPVGKPAARAMAGA